MTSVIDIHYIHNRDINFKAKNRCIIFLDIYLLNLIHCFHAHNLKIIRG